MTIKKERRTSSQERAEHYHLLHTHTHKQSSRLIRQCDKCAAAPAAAAAAFRDASGWSCCRCCTIVSHPAGGGSHSGPLSQNHHMWSRIMYGLCHPPLVCSAHLPSQPPPHETVRFGIARWTNGKPHIECVPKISQHPPKSLTRFPCGLLTILLVWFFAAT